MSILFQQKLEELRTQLHQLNQETLPEYIRRLRKVENNFHERNTFNEIVKEFEDQMLQEEYENEQRVIQREFEDNKVSDNKTL